MPQPFLTPCPICNGVEGCDHTLMERARAASARVAGWTAAKRDFARRVVESGSTKAKD
jgi:hypothetical protein